jgi:tetratricopeptide (TPR) repeat protein
MTDSSQSMIGDAVRLAVAAQEALSRGDAVAARAQAQAAAGLFRSHLGEDSADAANALVICSRAQCLLGDVHAAAASARGAIATMTRLPRGPALDRIRVQATAALGSILVVQGSYREAGRCLATALRDAEATLGGEDPDTAMVINGLGLVARYSGDFDAAARHYARALRIVEATLGREDPAAAALHHNLGGLAHARGEPAAGEPHARRALEIRRAAYGDAHPDVASDKGALASILHLLGRLDEAERLLRETARTFACLYGADHLEVAIAQTSLGA